MRFQKTIKRIVALGTGALMLSSAYAAADLSNYPAPFVKDGKFSGVLVVGDKAAAEDVIGITDIMSSLQAASVKKVSTTSGGVDVSFEGDAWKVGTSSRILELGERLSSNVLRAEAIANVTSGTYIDDSELSGLLASGQVSNSKGQADYEQRLYFEDATTGYVVYTESDGDVTGDFLYFANGKQIARYEMEFTTQLESDVDDATSGSASTTGTVLSDMEDVELNMLGKTFQIVTAVRGNSAGLGAILTLMGGAVRDTLLEGSTKTYTVGGKDYEVTLNFVDADEAQFVINGQTTRKLNDGDTDKLSDGTTVGVSEILYQDYAGGIHSSTFFIGAQKVELRDTNILDTGNSHEVKIDDETIDGVEVVIEGTDDNSTFRLDKISLNVSADDDFYVPAGGSLSEAIAEAGGEADALFTRNWDVEYKGLSKPAVSEISVKASGSDDYNLVFNDGRGNKATLPLANVPSGTLLRFGDTDDDLIINENKTITKDDYFVITDEADANGERQSFALRYKGADRSTQDNPIVKFDDLGSGERIERPISVGTSSTLGVFGAATGIVDSSQIAEIKLGGGTFRVYNASSHLADDFNIFVDLNAGGSLGINTVAINTKEGAAIAITNDTADIGVNLSITTPNADDYDDMSSAALVFDITAASGEGRLSKAGSNTLTYQSPQDDDDNEYTYTSQGAFVKLYSPTSDPQEVVISYPADQRVPLVYVTGKSATFTETEVSSGDAVTVQRIEVGAAKLASEVSDVKAQNTILVGGPCANAAAAAVMGNPADCTAGFEPGVGMLQLWEHSNGNVAMLVAGYSAVDTRNTAQVIANYKDYKNQLKGMKVEVKKVNNQLTVAQPVAKVVEEVVADETVVA